MSGKIDNTEEKNEDDDDDDDDGDVERRSKRREEREKQKMRGKNKSMKRYLRKHRKNVIDPATVLVLTHFSPSVSYDNSTDCDTEKAGEAKRGEKESYP